MGTYYFGPYWSNSEPNKVLRMLQGYNAHMERWVEREGGNRQEVIMKEIIWTNSNHAALSLVKTKAALKDSLVIWILLTVYNLLTFCFFSGDSLVTITGLNTSLHPPYYLQRYMFIKTSAHELIKSRLNTTVVHTPLMMAASVTLNYVHH